MAQRAPRSLMGERRITPGFFSGPRPFWRSDSAAWLPYVGRSKKAVKVKPTPIIWRKRGQYLLTCSGSVLPDPVRFSSPVRPRKPQNTTMAEANLASLMIRDVKWARCPFRRYATPQATPKVKMIVPRPPNTLFRTICAVGAIWDMASRQSSSVISPEGLSIRSLCSAAHRMKLGG